LPGRSLDRLLVCFALTCATSPLVLALEGERLGGLFFVATFLALALDRKGLGGLFFAVIFLALTLDGKSLGLFFFALTLDGQGLGGFFFAVIFLVLTLDGKRLGLFLFALALGDAIKAGRPDSRDGRRRAAAGHPFGYQVRFLFIGIVRPADDYFTLHRRTESENWPGRIKRT
jgi:hypothetical protein